MTTFDKIIDKKLTHSLQISTFDYMDECDMANGNLQSAEVKLLDYIPKAAFDKGVFTMNKIVQNYQYNSEVDILTTFFWIEIKRYKTFKKITFDSLHSQVMRQEFLASKLGRSHVLVIIWTGSYLELKQNKHNLPKDTIVVIGLDKFQTFINYVYEAECQWRMDVC
jgi:hypothetical protein